MDPPEDAPRKAGRFDYLKDVVPTVDEHGVPLPKNQIKKLRRTLKAEAKTEWQRQRTKETRKRKAAERLQAREAAAAVAATAATATGTAAHDAGETGARKRAASAGSDEQRPRKRRKPDWETVKQSWPKIVIDCDFNDLMTESEGRSLAQQIVHSYAKNKRADRLMHIVATTKDASCVAFQHMTARLHLATDNPGLELRSTSYQDAFPRESLVYLSADSPNVLTDLDADKAYVIGGLVDHNRYPKLCLERATALGIAHAQLPILDYVRMTQRRILAVNHVAEILMRYAVLRDWKAAFLEVIPLRKRREDEGAEAGAADDADADAGDADGVV